MVECEGWCYPFRRVHVIVEEGLEEMKCSWFGPCLVWGSHSSDYEDNNLLGCNAMQSSQSWLACSRMSVNVCQNIWHHIQEHSTLQILPVLYVACSQSFSWSSCHEWTVNFYPRCTCPVVMQAVCSVYVIPVLLIRLHLNELRLEGLKRLYLNLPFYTVL
jgi:hypothetical protein